MEQSAEAERRAYGELRREAWSTLLRAQPDLGFLSDERDTLPAGDVWRPEMREALQTGQVTPGEGDLAALAIPISVRDRVIGVIDGRKRDGTPWSPEEIDLLQAMGEQLNVALEGAQLYRDAQRREARERTIGQVTSSVRQSLEMEVMLRTAAEEIRRALGLEKIVVRLATSRDEKDLS
jgi:GAF domain-containing protein